MECSQSGRQFDIAACRNAPRIQCIYSGQFRKSLALDKLPHWDTLVHKRRN